MRNYLKLVFRLLILCEISQLNNKKITSLKMLKQLKFTYATENIDEQAKTLQSIIKDVQNIPGKKKESAIKQFQVHTNPQIKALKRIVGMIYWKKKDGEQIQLKMIGTGILLAPNIVLTCAHCVLDLENKKQNQIQKWVNDLEFRKLKANTIFFYMPNKNQAEYIKRLQPNQRLQRIENTKQFFYELNQIVISEKFLRKDSVNKAPNDQKSDWALIKLRLTKDQEQIVQRRIKKPFQILIEDIKTINKNNLRLQAYYIGFYDQDNINEFLPSYQFSTLDFKQGQIQHSIYTVGGSSGGALIYIVQVGMNQFRNYLVGVHRSKLTQSTIKYGTVLDSQFKRIYQRWFDDLSNSMAPKRIKHTFKEYNQIYGALKICQVSQNNKKQNVSKFMIKILKYIVNVSKHYLYFDYKDQRTKITVDQEDYQNQSQKLINDMKQIVKNVNEKDQVVDISIKHFPIHTILSEIDPFQDEIIVIDKLMKLRQQIRAHGMAVSFNSLIAYFINNLVVYSGQTQVQQKYKAFLNNLTSLIRPQSKNGPKSIKCLSIIIKLLEQYTIQSITKLLEQNKPKENGSKIINQIKIKQESLMKNVQLLIGNNIINRIKSTKLLLRHKFMDSKQLANWIPSQQQKQRIKNLFKNYGDIVSELINQNCKCRNYIFELQLQSLRFFSQQLNQTYPNEGMKIKIIMLTVFKQYYKGGHEVDAKLLTQSVPIFFNSIIKIIQLSFEDRLLSEIYSKALINFKEIRLLMEEFGKELKKEFISHCLIFHYHYNVKYNSTYSNLSILEKTADQINQKKIQTTDMINQSKQYIQDQLVKLQKSEKQLSQHAQGMKTCSQLHKQRKKDKYDKVEQQVRQIKKEIESIKIQAKQNQFKLKKLQLAYDYKLMQQKEDQINLNKLKKPEDSSKKLQILKQKTNIIKKPRKKQDYLSKLKQKSSYVQKPQKKLTSQQQPQRKHPHRNIQRLDDDDQAFNIYYDHIGMITIKNDQNQKYESYGTGTLIGKKVVLTAFHVVSKFVKYKIIQDNIRFELRGKTKNGDSRKGSNVIKIRYSEQFDWAMLYLQQQLIQQPKFSLITHANNIEPSFLVGKSYFCEIVGFSNEEDNRAQVNKNRKYELPFNELQSSDQEQNKPKKGKQQQKEQLLSRCQGLIFIKDQYSHGLKYSLSTTPKMSGSPIIIYPTGEYAQEPYILGIHVQGFDEEGFKLGSEKYYEEKYNYGNKVLKQIQDRKCYLTGQVYKEIIKQTIKEYYNFVQDKRKNINERQYSYRSVHQNSYEFSNIEYHKNKSVLIQRYYQQINIQKIDQKIQQLLFDQFLTYAKYGIIFSQMSYENILYQYNKKKINDKQKFAHRISNAQIMCFDTEYQKAQNQGKNKNKIDKLDMLKVHSKELFNRIVSEYIIRKKVNQLIQRYDFSSSTKSVQMKKDIKIQQNVQIGLAQKNVEVEPQNQPLTSTQQKRKKIIDIMSAKICNINDLQKAILNYQALTDRARTLIQEQKQMGTDEEAFQQQYYKELKLNREQLIKTLSSIEKANITDNIQKLLKFIESQIIIEKKIEVDNKIQQNSIQQFRKLKQIKQIEQFLNSQKNIKEQSVKFYFDDYQPKDKQGKQLYTNEQQEQFPIFANNYYNNIYLLYRKCNYKKEVVQNKDPRTVVLVLVENMIKLLILKSCDQIQAITYRYLLQVMPFASQAIAIQDSRWDKFEIPKERSAFSYSTYLQDVKIRAQRLLHVQKLEEVKDIQQHIQKMVDLSAVRHQYFQEYEKYRVYYQQNKKLLKTQSLLKVQKLDIIEDKISQDIITIYGYPSRQSLLNLSKIILQEIQCFSLLNFDSDRGKIKKSQRIDFKWWQMNLENIQIIKLEKKKEKKRKMKESESNFSQIVGEQDIQQNQQINTLYDALYQYS